MQTFRANDFELGHLDGWQDNSTIVLVGPGKPQFTPNLQVHREPEPEGSLADFVNQQRSELQGLPGFELRDHGDRTLGGQPAISHEYSWLPPEPALQGMRLVQRQLLCVRAGIMYTVTGSAVERDWAEAEAAFELSIGGFAWK